jgi:hypothetical protein
MPSPEDVKNMIESAGGKIESAAMFPDGHGCMTASFTLPQDHWLYEDNGFNVPPMPFRMGVNDAPVINRTRKMWEDDIRAAGRYAVRCATMNGKEQDFDPDALVQNLLVGMLGYFTENGFINDEWANPKEDNNAG